jgi:ABC-type Fe3+ transport system permease subunit
VDFWSIIKIAIFLFIILTILYPISTVVFRSITNSDGKLTIENFIKFFTTKYYMDVLKNSLFVSSVTTVFSIIIGVFLAYVLFSVVRTALILVTPLS